MSRVGKIPVTILDKVKVKVTDSEIIVKGPKGEAKQKLVYGVKVSVDEAEKKVVVDRETNQKEHRALHGLYRALIQNMVVGVTEGYECKLRIVGTGYRVELQGNKLTVQAGYCHPVEFVAPAGIELELPKSTSREYMDFIVRGIDKQLVNECAARLRRIRPPDLYLGKGIRYFGENVRKLEGKSFSSGG